jgi:hypothetical protein
MKVISIVSWQVLADCGSSMFRVKSSVEASKCCEVVVEKLAVSLLPLLKSLVILPLQEVAPAAGVSGKMRLAILKLPSLTPEP